MANECAWRVETPLGVIGIHSGYCARRSMQFRSTDDDGMDDMEYHIDVTKSHVSVGQ